MGLTWSDVKAAVNGLDAPCSRLLLVGSVPMLAHGLIDSVGDIDVLTDPATWQHLAPARTTRVGDAGDRIVVLDDVIEVFDGWYGQPHGVLDAGATTIDGLRVASLEEVLEFKQRLHRPKDLPHLSLLRRALNVEDD
jgi:hypothetical protein